VFFFKSVGFFNNISPLSSPTLIAVFFIRLSHSHFALYSHLPLFFSFVVLLPIVNPVRNCLIIYIWALNCSASPVFIFVWSGYMCVCVYIYIYIYIYIYVCVCVCVFYLNICIT
jgi:hypothetical protein